MQKQVSSKEGNVKLKFRNTLVTKFTVMILFILVVGQGILYTWLLLYQKSYLETKLRSDVLLTAQQIAEMASTSGGDDKAFDRFQDALLKGGLVLSIKVIDGKGARIVEKIAPGVLSVSETDDDWLGPFAFFFAPSVSTVRVPPEAGAAVSVEVRYSGQSVNEVMKRFLVIPPVMQFITFVVVIYAIITFFKKKVTLPVESINNVLLRITAGDLAAEVPEIGESEIGSIAKGMRFLIENLATTIARFNSISSHAAFAMDQLTVTLKNVSEATRRQAGSIDSVISAIRSASEAHRKTTENTDKLSRSSSENVSSLLEIKSAAEEIASSTEKLFTATADSYAMVTELSQTSKVIADNAGEVSRAVENTSSAVQEISASLNSVRENTKTSSGLSGQVRMLLTERGTLTMVDAVEAMEKIEDSVVHTEKIVTRLAERSKDIAKILSVITDVTARTNVLSLNAAILAAAAGVHGKGFSIVADEIRELSDRTSASARDIAAIIGTIQFEIREAAGSIQAGVAKVQEGKDLILKSGEAIGESLEAAQKSAQMAAVVEKSTEEQAEGLKQIRVSMENVRLMIEQVVRATEEEKKGSAHMLESIGDVKEVADLVKKGTGDHVRGATAISKNMESTLLMVSQMHQAALSQLSVNEGIVKEVDEVRSAGISAMKDMEEVTSSFGTLRDEIEILKLEMKKFKTRNTSGASS